MSAYGNAVLAGIEMIKPLLPLIPDEMLRASTGAALSLLAVAVETVDTDYKTPDEFRADMAKHLGENWQALLNAKFGG